MAAVRVPKKTARKPAIRWPQSTVERPSAQVSSIPTPKPAVESRPAQGAPVRTPKPAVVSQPAQGSPGSASREEDPPQRASGLGESPRYSLEVEQDQVCLRVEPLKPKEGKAKKGLGPSRGKAVGVLPVLPSLTPIQGPEVTQREGPMEVGDSLDSDAEWLLEVSQVELEVPQGSGAVATEEATTKKGKPVVPQGEEVTRKVPEGPATRETPAKLGGKSHHFRHEVSPQQRQMLSSYLTRYVSSSTGVHSPGKKSTCPSSLTTTSIRLRISGTLHPKNKTTTTTTTSYFWRTN
ncbi:unnamed protein product [Leuciscus chuanchicus]